MTITAYKTSKVQSGDDLYLVLDTYLPPLKEKDIVAISGKIVSICQGSVVKNDGTVEKQQLIEKEADYYIDPSDSRYDITLTIKRDILIASAGIDESNGNDYFILWPKDIERATVDIWQHLRTKHHLRHLGVIITDSHIIPLRWGTRGIGLSWCGFEALKNYIGTPDIFGKNLRMTKLSVIDGLAGAAVLTMGEGNEQTPLAIIQDATNTTFQNQPPTPQEIQAMRITLEDDIYAPLINSSEWKPGKNHIPSVDKKR